MADEPDELDPFAVDDVPDEMDEDENAERNYDPEDVNEDEEDNDEDYKPDSSAKWARKRVLTEDEEDEDEDEFAITKNTSRKKEQRATSPSLLSSKKVSPKKKTQKEAKHAIASFMDDIAEESKPKAKKRKKTKTAALKSIGLKSDDDDDDDSDTINEEEGDTEEDDIETEEDRKFIVDSGEPKSAPRKIKTEEIYNIFTGKPIVGAVLRLKSKWFTEISEGNEGVLETSKESRKNIEKIAVEIKEVIKSCDDICQLGAFKGNSNKEYIRVAIVENGKNELHYFLVPPQMEYDILKRMKDTQAVKFLQELREHGKSGIITMNDFIKEYRGNTKEGRFVKKYYKIPGEPVISSCFLTLSDNVFSGSGTKGNARAGKKTTPSVTVNEATPPPRALTNPTKSKVLEKFKEKMLTPNAAPKEISVRTPDGNVATHMETKSDDSAKINITISGNAKEVLSYFKALM